MDPSGYLDAATMTDLLADWIPRDRWQEIMVPGLGSPARVFAHLIRVRGVYRAALATGRVEFPGVKAAAGIDLFEQLSHSAQALAEGFTGVRVPQVEWGGRPVSVLELYATAVQHEGIHQGQWQVALQQAGLETPGAWRADWGLG